MSYSTIDKHLQLILPFCEQQIGMLEMNENYAQFKKNISIFGRNWKEPICVLAKMTRLINVCK